MRRTQAPPTLDDEETGEMADDRTVVHSPFGAGLVDKEIGGFHLSAYLGEGGMAYVFRGENLLDGSIVRAIKVVRPELSAQPEFLRRFKQEAAIMERLQHPHIVRFYGVRREGSLLLMELELLEGESLAEAARRFEKGALPIRSALTWLYQAAEGVATAHELGIVHRDLKPENLFLTRAGAVKVLDFGIARVVDDADRAQRMTTAGRVPGTPQYMSPEVCAGSVPTAAADVYALGMTLYELLVGFHPYNPPGKPARSGVQLMYAQTHEALPAVRTFRNDVSPLLQQVVLRATAKKVEDRFTTGRDFADALRGVIETLPIETRGDSIGAQTRFALPQFAAPITTDKGVLIGNDAAPHNPGRRNLIIGLAVVLVMLAAVAVYLLRGEKAAVVAVAVPPTIDAGSVRVEAPPPDAAPERNTWVRIDPPSTRSSGRDVVLLGVRSEKTAEDLSGFRPSRQVTPPSVPYEIQQHEVTWAELEPWLAKNPKEIVQKPGWLPANPAERADFPATGMLWSTAYAYCKAIGGRLPSEEEWEYAARGPDPERRPYAWGNAPLDKERTHVYAGSEARLRRVMTSDQDQTPGSTATAIHDLIGNAQEWTADLWREDRLAAGKDEVVWDNQQTVTIRAVRGLPVATPSPSRPPAEGAAHRERFCAGGTCVDRSAARRAFVGFRCVRSVDTAVTKERR